MGFERRGFTLGFINSPHGIAKEERNPLSLERLKRGALISPTDYAVEVSVRST